jgi:DNA processing protein
MDHAQRKHQTAAERVRVQNIFRQKVMTLERTLSDEERISWLQLSLTENVGPVTFRDLLSRFATATEAIKNLPDLSRRGGRRQPLKLYSRSRAEDDIARALAVKARWVVAGEQGYPTYLRHIHGSPPLLCVSGRFELAQVETAAIVGARNASAMGLKFTRMLAAGLAEAGYVVASGLARGIDTAAHQASVSKATAAVVAGGIDYYYPPENEKLQREIAERGLLISEMVPGTAPKAEHFPRRNRIISGMSRAIIVVEAALRSGSLITARFAAEQGRDVFAVPGSPLDPRCEGANRLIKDGAQILTSAEDAIQALQGASQPRNPIFLEPDTTAPLPEPDTSEEGRTRVITLLSPTETHLDDITRESGLTPQMVAAIILELELAGRVTRQAGGTVALLV